QDTCNCGGHGCLEQTASATGLVREAKRLLQAAPEKTFLVEYKRGFISKRTSRLTCYERNRK
ncbi:MAG: ROK family protein, partial [Lachnospiraceae bacterium]|nr:ROK family protein [Lachnospiraceae bacterium]